MMPKPLLALNAALVVVSVLLVGYIVRQLTAPRPRPLAGRPPAAMTATGAPALAGGKPPAAAYMTVASRNLFSPSRSEATQPTGIASVPLNVPRPNLFGVILREGSPVAYLEDPATKRVTAYRVGDSVGGGTVQSIAADHVVLARPDGNVDVRLHDPTRPRPVVPVGPPPTAGSIPVTPPPAMGQIPGQVPGQVPGQAMVPQPGGPFIPQPMPAPPAMGQVPDQGAAGRRPLPPNLLRRVPPPAPPGTVDDAQR